MENQIFDYTYLIIADFSTQGGPERKLERDSLSGSLVVIQGVMPLN